MQESARTLPRRAEQKEKETVDTGGVNAFHPHSGVASDTNKRCLRGAPLERKHVLRCVLNFTLRLSPDNRGVFLPYHLHPDVQTRATTKMYWILASARKMNTSDTPVDTDRLQAGELRE